jgi:hypothetical protein
MAVDVELVIVAIVVPQQAVYKSLQARVKSLADQMTIAATYLHIPTVAKLEGLVAVQDNGHRDEHLFLCCDIADGPTDTADKFHVAIKKIWRAGRNTWLGQRPLTVITDSDEIRRQMETVAKDGRAHSYVLPKLPNGSRNDWRNIRDALQEGIANA